MTSERPPAASSGRTSPGRGPGSGGAPGTEPSFVTTRNFPHTPSQLFHVQIGLTYACQCRCEHCGVSQQKNRERLLRTEEIVDVCRQAKELGAFAVELFGGEPLLRREIREIVSGCAEHLDVWMSTNALAFTRELVDDLKGRGLSRAFISLDSAHPERHDANRRHPGAFDAVMRAVDWCVDAGIDVNFSTCAASSLVAGGELEELVAFTKASRAAKLRLVLPKMVGRLEGCESCLLTKAEIEKVRQITAREEIAYVEAEGNYSDRIEKCFCLRGHVYVNPWGVVQPCVYTFLDFGSVREHPLAFLYERMFRHEIFRDKSILNLCLLQNVDFVKQHLSEVTDDDPLVKVKFVDPPPGPTVGPPR